jgi:hypothetical protein
MNLQAPKGKVIVSVDLEGKNSWTFAHGQTIRLERGVENLNFREVNPVNAVCLASDSIPIGAEVLIHHNAVHETFRVNNLQQLGGETTATSVKIYSIPEEECFLWRTEDMEHFSPCKGYATALRVFEPYKGLIAGIEPTRMKGVLYLTSGELKGQVCRLLHAADYEIVFQNRDGREGRIIRVRHYEGETHDREEVICILPTLGEMVKKGELWVGLRPSDARPLNP